MFRVRQFLTDEDGPTAVEYAVLLAMILMSCIIAVKTVGGATSGIWATNQRKLQDAGF